jgi:hypothetical protein
LISAFINIISFVNSVSGKLKSRGFRKLLLVAGCLLLFVNNLFGQAVVGDYRSVVDGNWSVRTNWRRWNGVAWNIPTFGQGYPGQNSTPGRIDINNNITLNVSPANPVGDLYINTGTLELASSNFTVNGTTNITSTLSDNDGNGYVVFSGAINVSNSATWRHNQQ